MPVTVAYENLNTSDLPRRGMEPATAPVHVLLVDLEADLVIRDGERTVCAVEDFPVAELARALVDWLGREPERDGFRFESMSFEEVGTVRIEQTTGGWRVGSVFEPDGWTAPVAWEVLVAELTRFTDAVREGVTDLGADPALIPALSTPPAGYSPGAEGSRRHATLTGK
ncbi:MULTISPECIES: hypothetical protein [Streptomyces]|uniref:DUF7878 domain-containing protein n=1 Tax=Streptomyces TaxID=1883 RepID=UPI000AD6A2DD|nr:MULTISPECIES: hypothetical protein [Streptomyces]